MIEQMVTIKDIADKAGVSIMTVSNAMNGNVHKMGKSTYDKVMRVIEELEYIPNASARSLTLRRSNIIALWLPSYYSNSLLEIPYNSYIAGAIERYIYGHEYNLMLVSDDSAEDFSNRLLSWNIDGGIGLGIAPKDVEYIDQKLEKPFVFLDSYFESTTIYSVSTDDYKGGYIGTKYLLDHGHRNIAIATGKEINNINELKENGVLYNRFKGYAAALTEKGIPVSKSNLIGETISYDGGLLAGAHISRQSDITAVFCTADIMAAGVSEGIRVSGKSVPNHISVVGFDDLPISQYVTPKLTTVKQQNKAKGEKAVEILMNLIKEKQVRKKSYVFDVEIVERDSVESK